MRAKLITPLALLALLVLAASPALAHSVNVFAYLENGKLAGEGYFKGGDKCINCVVKVLSADGKVRAQSVTDKQGAFTLPLPKQAPPLTVVLEAGAGHRAEYKLTAADLEGGAESPVPAASSPEPGEAKEPAAPAAEAPTARVAPAVGLGAEELERIVKQAVQVELGPINAQLARLAAKDETSYRDIIGGLGWILGLFGIAAWFKSRQGGGKKTDAGQG